MLLSRGYYLRLFLVVWPDLNERRLDARIDLIAHDHATKNFQRMINDEFFLGLEENPF